MSREKLTRTRCDRCKSVIEEVPDSTRTVAGDPEVTHPLLYIERDGKELLKFEDLDQKCRDRVDHLLKQLCLEKADEKADTDGDDSGDDKKPETKDTAAKDKNKGNGKGKGKGSSAGAGATA